MRYVSNDGSTSPFIEVSESDFKIVIKKLDAKCMPGWKAAGYRVDGADINHTVGFEPCAVHNHGWLLHRDHLHLIDCKKGFEVVESSDYVKGVCEKAALLKNNSTKNSSSAFPLPLGSETVEGCEGMTLRDYFAAKAMVAIMTNEDELNRIRCSYQENKQRIAIAHHAYAIADAMIEARKHE